MPPKKKGNGGWGGRVSQERDYECCNHVKLKNSTQKIFLCYLFIYYRILQCYWFHQIPVFCNEIVFIPIKLFLHFPNLLQTQVIGINLSVVIMVLKSGTRAKSDLPPVIGFGRFLTSFGHFDRTSTQFPIEPVKPAGLVQFLKPWL